MKLVDSRVTPGSTLGWPQDISKTELGGIGKRNILNYFRLLWQSPSGRVHLPLDWQWIFRFPLFMWPSQQSRFNISPRGYTGSATPVIFIPGWRGGVSHQISEMVYWGNKKYSRHWLFTCSFICWATVVNLQLKFVHMFKEHCQEGLENVHEAGQRWGHSKDTGQGTSWVVTPSTSPSLQTQTETLTMVTKLLENIPRMACKLMKLHVSSSKYMQAYETACKLIKMHASLWYLHAS